MTKCVKNSECASGCCKGNVCQTQLSIDDPCTGDLWCQQGHECQSIIRRCRPRGHLALSQCHDNTHCHPSKYCLMHQCTSRHYAGGACGIHDSCEDGLMCVDKKCVHKCLYGNPSVQYCPSGTTCLKEGYCAAQNSWKTLHIIIGVFLGLVMLVIFLILAAGLFRKHFPKKSKPVDIRPIVLPATLPNNSANIPPPPLYSDESSLPPPPAYEDVIPSAPRSTDLK